jgi:hypothetical protein
MNRISILVYYINIVYPDQKNTRPFLDAIHTHDKAVRRTINQRVDISTDNKSVFNDVSDKLRENGYAWVEVVSEYPRFKKYKILLSESHPLFNLCRLEEPFRSYGTWTHKDAEKLDTRAKELVHQMIRDGTVI